MVPKPLDSVAIIRSDLSERSIRSSRVRTASGSLASTWVTADRTEATAAPGSPCTLK